MSIRCSVCDKGTLKPGRVKDHDFSADAGLEGVTLAQAPALVCSACGAVALEGETIEAALAELTRVIVREGDELRPREAAFLRAELGMKQAELAERLGVTRVTVARWETGEEPLGRVQSLALRTLAAWHLGDAKLAREVGEPKASRAERTGPPYIIRAA